MGLEARQESLGKEQRIQESPYVHSGLSLYVPLVGQNEQWASKWSFWVRRWLVTDAPGHVHSETDRAEVTTVGQRWILIPSREGQA